MPPIDEQEAGIVAHSTPIFDKVRRESEETDKENLAYLSIGCWSNQRKQRNKKWSLDTLKCRQIFKRQEMKNAFTAF